MMYSRRLFLTGCWSALAVAVGAQNPPPNPADFDWNSITPNTDLEYHSCYGAFQCARLNVPLNWFNQTADPRKATIAMIKYPAAVPETDPTFGGSIIINPGGPGDVGVEFLLGFADYLRDTVDVPGKSHFELVTFDPRGVGRTLPSSNCLPGDQPTRDGFFLESRGNGPLYNGDTTIAYSLAMYSGWGSRCFMTGDSMNFVNTPSVARDMVEMVDQIEALRKGTKPANINQSPTLKGEPGNVARLNYLGFSYGTILGNYFASMFPGRVGKMVLDGVCDANDYSTGPGWLTNLADAEQVFNVFFQGCFTAGPNVCAIAQAGDKSASDIRGRFNKFLSNLDKNPQSIILPPGVPIVVSGSDIREIIGSLLYNPTQDSKNLGFLLFALMSGNFDVMGTVLDATGVVPVVRDDCFANVTDPNAPAEPIIEEARDAVLCSDGGDVTGKSLSYWSNYVHQLQSISPTFGPNWATLRTPCSGWKFKANWSFKGPFTSPKPNSALVSGVPQAPIYFVSNRLDPACPLRSAQAMAALHPGSSVLIQESMGHTALISAVSNCTRQAVAQYYATGTIPKVKSCNVSCGPWDASCPGSASNGATPPAKRSLSFVGSGINSPLRRGRSLLAYMK